MLWIAVEETASGVRRTMIQGTNENRSPEDAHDSAKVGSLQMLVDEEFRRFSFERRSIQTRSFPDISKTCTCVWAKVVLFRANGDGKGFMQSGMERPGQRTFRVDMAAWRRERLFKKRPTLLNMLVQLHWFPLVFLHSCFTPTAYIPYFFHLRFLLSFSDLHSCKIQTNIRAL